MESQALVPVRDKRLKVVSEGSGTLEALERFVAKLPEPRERERRTQSLALIRDYNFALFPEREAANENLEAALDSLELGLPRQARHHLAMAEDRVFFDYSNKAIVITGRFGFRLSPLAKLGAEPGSSFQIQGPEHAWLFKRADEFERAIPASVLKNAKALKALGIGWHQLYVAEPFVPKTPEPSIEPLPRIFPSYSPGPRKDPILAISVGRWLLEVGRW